MTNSVKRMPIALGFIVCLLFSSCALPLEGEDDVESTEADSPVAVESVGQELTFNGNALMCEKPGNGKCNGIYGRVCHYKNQVWCEKWVCGSNGCSWQ